MNLFKVATFALIGSISSCAPSQPDTWTVVVSSPDAQKLRDHIIEMAKSQGLKIELVNNHDPKGNRVPDLIISNDELVASLETHPSLNELTLFSNLAETTKNQRPLLISLYERFCKESNNLGSNSQLKQIGSVALPSEVGCPPLDPLNDKRLRKSG
jgi:hypothetical protein